LVEHWFFYFIIAYGITLVPVIGKYFSVLNTLFHEVGHALFALLFDGKVKSIVLFASTEGVATTSSRFWIARVITSYAGYTFASFIAFLSFYFIHLDKTTFLLYGFMIATFLSLVFWIRNWYGVIWCLSFLSICILLVLYGTPLFQDMMAFFLAALLLTQSVSTAYTIFMLSIKKPKDAGDATNLAKHTFIPAPVWGTLFFIQSLYAAFLVFKYFIF
jgi:hypothetical protein